jgi:hypothetical protein
MWCLGPEPLKSEQPVSEKPQVVSGHAIHPNEVEEVLELQTRLLHRHHLVPARDRPILPLLNGPPCFFINALAKRLKVRRSYGGTP